MKTNKLRLLWVLCPLVANPGQAQTLFSEDFESYQAGTQLGGQGGWGASLKVGFSTNLNSIVLDGRQPIINDSGWGMAGHLVNRPLRTNEITRFIFTAFATTVPPIATNSGMYLSVVGYGPNLGWFVRTVPGGPGWTFDARPVTHQSGSYVDVLGGYDAPVNLGVVIDGPAGNVYGTYNFGSGQETTQRFPITPTSIASLTAVFADSYFDWGARGAQFDNLRVVVAPQAPSLDLTIIGDQIGLSLAGTTGSIYRVEFAFSPMATNWTTLTNLVLPVSPCLVLEEKVQADQAAKFYRAAALE
ncbi:MAG: hypothetical protein U1F83_20505 [Verrucomicrobiota bacterium]